ncbi:hypothetical protein [Aeromonas veronii]|uniref:hypothetical protein n=1 Tax=Aeromonas veronii TaxID=654 RepID=UPI0030D0DA7B
MSKSKDIKWKFFFGASRSTDASPLERIVFSSTLYNPMQGFGWTARGDLNDRNRGGPTKKLESLVLGFSPATFRVDIKNGTYLINIYVGDSLHDNHITKVALGQNIIFESKAKLGVYYKYSFCINVDSGIIELNFDSPVNNWIINHIELESCEKYFPTIERDILYFTNSHWEPPKKGINENYYSFYSSPVSDVYIPSTEISRLDYLNSIKDGVFYFRKYQAKSGEIIDPYLNVEFQYATPFYAYCSALISKEFSDSSLLQSSILAFEFSLNSLITQSAATQHEDFFSSPLAHTFNILKEHVPNEIRLDWEKKFLSMNPFDIYRHVVGGSGSDGSNWNCKALSGEWLLHKQGVRNDISFFTHSLNLQGRFFNNKFDLYAEGPFVYDIFPRAWLYDFIEHHYDGELKDVIGDTLDSAAISSLFMQSSSGLLPLGGRSGLHIWGDVLQILLFEIAAKRSMHGGDIKQAGIFKRAAHIAYKSVCTWKDDDSILPIVRNKCGSALRHGFEGYSSHTQYGLLTLGILGYAWEHAESSESLREVVTPAEVGSYMIDLPSPFNTIIASCAGNSIQIHKHKIKGQNPVGLNKISLKGLSPSLPMMDGFVSGRAYHLAFNIFDKDCSLTIQWCDESGDIKQLSDFDEKEFQIVISNKVIHENYVYFETHYTSKFISFYMAYEVSEPGVAVKIICENEVKIRFVMPIFSSDGKEKSTLTCKKNKVHVNFKNSNFYYTATENIVLLRKDYGFRGGTFFVAHTDFCMYQQTLFISKYE